MTDIQLALTSDEDFDWLLGRSEATRPWSIAPQLAPLEVFEIIRPLPANWLIVADTEVVGLIGIKAEAAGEAEIGYGIAATRQGRGFASAAVGALLSPLGERGIIKVLAETSVDNIASQRVLERNGFSRTGERIDEEDGPLILWARRL
jgi:RimJ/RimL family protein N-acetyltransferase